MEHVSTKETDEISNINDIHIDTQSNYNNCPPMPTPPCVFDDLMAQKNL